MKPIQIIEQSYMGFRPYVAMESIELYDNSFFHRKSHNLKFALSFFNKYLDLEVIGNDLKHPYDIFLINYWLYEVPDTGLKTTKLLKKYTNGRKKYIEKITRELNKLIPEDSIYDRAVSTGEREETSIARRFRLIESIMKGNRIHPDLRTKMSKASGKFFDDIQKSRQN